MEKGFATLNVFRGHKICHNRTLGRSLMKLRSLRQLLSLRDLRNALLGLAVVIGGIGLSGVTYYAHLTGQSRLAGIAAGVSLIFVLIILIFVVPPLARNASKEASQMNLPFDLTAGGAVMFGLIVIVGFSAWNTGNNLLFLVLSFLVGAMVVSFFAGSISLKKLDVRMRFPETIYAGQETPVLVSIHNRKRLFPSFSIIAEVRGKERDTSIIFDDLANIFPERVAAWIARPPVVRRMLSYFVFLPRSEVTETKSRHIFRNRGRFVIKDFELSTRFPFGFFRHRRRLPARETELIIYPEIVPVGDMLENLPIDAGKLAAAKRGSGQDLLALRDYQPNDDLRRVDWKATARARHLIVREFAAEDDVKVTVHFDNRMPDNSEKKMTFREKIESEQVGKSVVESELFERGVSFAASLISQFCGQQAEVRLDFNNEKGEFGIGNAHLHDCLKRLALIRPVPRDSTSLEVAQDAAKILDESENSHHILVTAFDPTAFPAELAAVGKIMKFE